MIDYGFYRFADQTAYTAACEVAGINLLDPAPTITLDVIGAIPGRAGFHVNAAWNGTEEPASFVAASVEPVTPVRVFAQRGES